MCSTHNARAKPQVLQVALLDHKMEKLHIKQHHNLANSQLKRKIQVMGSATETLQKKDTT